uniref:ATP synthase complex subunit 8 n=1 Tax=Geotrypetes seraphini TaxID=260995 RepID=C8UZS4_GEOSA|nr:ATP synthase F0 subunit 8 [Geotrypetes seraphini]AAX58652.1 ATP synthase F0 subunit 8 [Geotrypetes seraphini]
MPQLNPSPWFAMLMMTWMILLLLLMKTNVHNTSNPMMSYSSTIKLNPWLWPW